MQGSVHVDHTTNLRNSVCTSNTRRQSRAPPWASLPTTPKEKIQVNHITPRSKGVCISTTPLHRACDPSFLGPLVAATNPKADFLAALAEEENDHLDLLTRAVDRHEVAAVRLTVVPRVVPGRRIDATAEHVLAMRGYEEESA